MHERFREVCAELLAGFQQRIEACVEQLSEDELWWRPNAAVNSVGNLLQHLHGNLSQWVLDALGGESSKRRRSREFTAERTAPKAELLSGLGRVTAGCQSVIRGLSEETLLRPRRIQGYECDGVYALLHAVEHMSYHTGQIVALTKELRGPAAGIDFYPQHRGE